MSFCLALTDADWALTKDVFSIIGTIASAAGVGLAFYVGLVGLSTWQRQLSGTASHELAKRALIELYKFRESLDRVRNPLMLASEFSPTVVSTGPQSEAVSRYLGRCSAYDERFRLVTEARRNLDVVLLEAEALWGSDLKLLVKPLNDKSWDLYHYIENHLLSTDPRIDQAERAAYVDINKGQPNIMYRRSDVSKDDFARSFNQDLSKTEVYLRRKLA
ncbi:hypothetical protein [Pseudomonas sp.]|uniref:hypothetical protein n=1 Tax=Pseudomonas sp. TaxID=306 RepID=UPI0028AB851B|nr:hypothetical protein [Pseudomonas sp.]